MCQDDRASDHTTGAHWIAEAPQKLSPGVGSFSLMSCAYYSRGETGTEITRKCVLGGGEGEGRGLRGG